MSVIPLRSHANHQSVTTTTPSKAVTASHQVISEHFSYCKPWHPCETTWRENAKSTKEEKQAPADAGHAYCSGPSIVIDALQGSLTPT